ncbi:tRNA-binding protein [Christensenellaceae bacterium OttesenSCG-928-M15]|nr:tRNA-binding protein [Christensenellaceae bacterium OttesenSCG-928-M15]
MAHSSHANPIKIGEIVRVEEFPGLKKPAYKIFVDCGGSDTALSSYAHVTELYLPEDLIGKQVAVIFMPKRKKGFLAEVRILCADTPEGMVVLQPETPVANGAYVDWRP